MRRRLSQLAVDVGPLRASRDFRLLWFGELVSQTGSQVTTVVALAGAADVISAVFRSSSQQMIVPDSLRGRLSALNILVVAGGVRLGDFEAGVAGSLFSPFTAVVSGGVLCLVGVGAIAAAVPEFSRWRSGAPAPD